MRCKYVVFFLFVFFITSCNYIPLKKEKSPQLVDTIIDYTKVDVPPTFTNCKRVPEKDKNTCFREEITKRITKALKEFDLISNDSVKEVVLINLYIDNKGVFKTKMLSLPLNIKTKFPALENNIKNVVAQLPRVAPALKRGVPVATAYQLPIQITH